MKHLCDANVFIAVAVEQHIHHPHAALWFESLGDEDTTAFCRATQNSFLRLLTRKIAENYVPQTNRKAWETYDQLCRDDAVVFAEEAAGLETVWRKLASRDTVSPKVWMDAYLAAFAISSGLRFVTLDADFKSFVAQGLDLILLNPGA
jgi:uncharacterized protein